MSTVYASRVFVTAGGLIYYGPDLMDHYRSAAGYLDRILRGENLADFPVQEPDKLELAINLKTTKALGLTVPPTVLARANQVLNLGLGLLHLLTAETGTFGLRGGIR